jgi:antitoxin PrlF
MLESVITAKAQTTLPKGVREALGVSAGDHLGYIIEHDRAIIMKARPVEVMDGDMDAFLRFLEADLVTRRRVAPASAELLERADALVGSLDVNVDDPIEGDLAF